MAYVKKVWVGKNADGSIPDNAIPISAENLNKMEDGIYEATATADNNSKRLSDLEEWMTLGSVSSSETLSGDYGDEESESTSLIVPCDNSVIDECNHFRLIVKADSRFYVNQTTTKSTAECSLTVSHENSGSFISISTSASETKDGSNELILDEDLIVGLDVLKRRSIKKTKAYDKEEPVYIYEDYIEALKTVTVTATTDKRNNSTYGYRHGYGEYSITVELQGRR